MELLKRIALLCEGGAEVDDTVLAREMNMPLSTLRAELEKLDAAGLVRLEEYGFSCTVEYAVSGLTELGEKAIQK